MVSRVSPHPVIASTVLPLTISVSIPYCSLSISAASLPVSPSALKLINNLLLSRSIALFGPPRGIAPFFAL